MQRTTNSALNATQQRLTPPSGATTLDHVHVSNPAATTVYLNFWTDSATSGAPALSITAIADQVAIPTGVAQPVLMDLPLLASGTLVVSASTAADGTGAPSSDLQASFRWGPVSR
jgi:hypothetical protein